MIKVYPEGYAPETEQDALDYLRWTLSRLRGASEELTAAREAFERATNNEAAALDNHQRARRHLETFLRESA